MKPQIKECPSCKKSFGCNAADIAKCQCSELEIEPEVQNKISLLYSDCLCNDCLANLKQGVNSN